MYENIKTWKYTNVHAEKYQCEKCKGVCKESKYLHKKTIK